jgi:osmotically-inducible protein OsmY
MKSTIAESPLLATIHGALSNSPYVPTKQVTIEANDGHVRLEGQVRSFFQKQMAQELVRRLDGVDRVENLLQVNWR